MIESITKFWQRIPKAVLFGVASAFCWALALIITRKISNSDTPQTTVLWSAAIGTAVLTLLLPFEAIWPTPGQLALCLVLGILAFLQFTFQAHSPSGGVGESAADLGAAERVPPTEHAEKVHHVRCGSALLGSL